MGYKLIFKDSSEVEAKEAIDYYCGINLVLGDRFLMELLEIYEKLAATPEYYSYISSVRPNTIRDVKLPSFPYVVIYEIIEDSVYIIAIMNCHRKPLKLQ